MSLLGDGMLVRLRSVSIALFGLATVVGLGLTVFIAQLGFPGVFSSPIPGDSSKAGSVGGAIALAPSGSIGSPAHLRGGRRAATVHAPHGARSPVDAGLGDSRSLVASPASQPGPGVAPPPPSPIPAPEPESQPVTPAPVSSPSPSPPPDSTVASEPKSTSESQSKKTSSSKSKSKPKSSGSAPSKATSDKDKPEGSSTGKSKGRQVGKGASHYPPPPKSYEDSSGQTEEDKIAPPSKTAAPAPVEDKSKQVPEVPEKGAGKEPVESGKSDKSRH